MHEMFMGAFDQAGISWSTEGARAAAASSDRVQRLQDNLLTDEEGVRHEMEGPGQRDD